MPGAQGRSPAHYSWLAATVTDAELEQAYRTNALFDAHRDDPEFDYRFLVDEARVPGEPKAERTAWRICFDPGWWSAFGKPKKGDAKRPGPPVHDHLCAVVDEKGRVRHEFTADAPNELRIANATRIERTYHRRRRPAALGRMTPSGSRPS